MPSACVPPLITFQARRGVAPVASTTSVEPLGLQRGDAAGDARWAPAPWRRGRRSVTVGVTARARAWASVWLAPFQAPAFGLVDDEVAADDRQAVVGAVQPDVAWCRRRRRCVLTASKPLGRAGSGARGVRLGGGDRLVRAREADGRPRRRRARRRPRPRRPPLAALRSVTLVRIGILHSRRTKEPAATPVVPACPPRRRGAPAGRLHDRCVARTCNVQDRDRTAGQSRSRSSSRPTVRPGWSAIWRRAEQHAGGEGDPVERVVPDREGLPHPAEHDLLVGDEPAHPQPVHADAVDVGPAGAVERPVEVASGTGPRPASRRAAAISCAVRRAVPDGASALSGWCSSTISTDS